MNTNPSHLPLDPIAAAERALMDAGLSFTAVDACPQPGCEVCADLALPTAA
jgi:hypothetical protein